MKVVVKAEWLEACGKRDLVGVPLEVGGQQEFLGVAVDYRTFYELRLPGGYRWVVSVGRVSHCVLN